MINYRNIIQSIEFLGIDNMNYYLNREKNGKFQSISKKIDSDSITLRSVLGLKRLHWIPVGKDR